MKNNMIVCFVLLLSFQWKYHRNSKQNNHGCLQFVLLLPLEVVAMLSLLSLQEAAAVLCCCFVASSVLFLLLLVGAAAEDTVLRLAAEADNSLIMLLLLFVLVTDGLMMLSLFLAATAELLLLRSFGNSAQWVPTCCEPAVTTTLAMSRLKLPPRRQLWWNGGSIVMLWLYVSQYLALF
jgi:hypothetical protein